MSSGSGAVRRRLRIGGDVREAIVVILSILIAFGLDAWWNERGQIDEARLQLGGVRAEFDLNRAQLVDWIDVHRRIGGASNGLGGLLLESGLDGEGLIPDSMVSALFLTPSFDPATGALEGLLASEVFTRIRDPELRQELAGWMGVVRDAQEDENHALELTRRELAPTVGQYANLSLPIKHAWPWATGDSVPESFLSGTTRVPRTPRLLNFALQRAIYARWATRELEIVLEQLDRIMTLIDDELGLGVS